jgi:hypothetical protein
MSLSDAEGLKFALALLSFVFAMGFFIGYAVRELISLRHHAEAQKNRLKSE